MSKLLETCQLLNTKLCHDIAGLIGAVKNAIDYTNSPDESIRNQAKTLLVNSASELTKRLSFYRETYGTIRNEAVAINSVQHFLDDFLNKEKFSVSLENDSKINEISELTFKFCLALANIGAAAIPRGGSIIISFNKSDNDNYASLSYISITGKMIIKKEEIFKILQGKHTEITSSNINVYYTHLLSKELKKNIDIEIKDDKITYKII